MTKRPYGVPDNTNRSINPAIREFKRKIQHIYGSKLRSVILYGSWARNTATDDSDIDLMVVLAGRVRAGREIDRMTKISADLDMKYRVLISIIPVSQNEYSRSMSPLLLNVRREGIAI